MNHQFPKFLLLIALLCCSLTTADAQFGKIKNKLKKVSKQEKEEARPEPAKTPAPVKTQPKANTNQLAAAAQQAQPLPALVYDQPYAPAVVYESLLDAVKVNPSNGLLMIGSDMTASFLPTTDERGSTAFYGSKPEQHKLAVHIVKDGETLKKYLTMVMQRDNGELRSGMKGPFADFSIASNGYAEQQGYDTEKLYFTQAGEYALEFYLDGKRVYQFPFSVRIIGSDDPYASEDKVYAIDGPWSDVVYIDIAFPVTPEAFATLKTYTRVPDFNQPDLTYLVAAQLTRNGKALLYGKNLMAYGTKDSWNKQQLNLAKPWKDHNGISAGEHLQIKDILKDGSYELTLNYYTGQSGMKGSEQPHPGPAGEQTETYTFTVKNGAIQPQGWQQRDGVKAERFIEGGRSHFWLVRQGSTYFK